ncbi:urease accessory protein UreF [Vibrio sp. Of7-15]|uniref:urease accessory protein UreF n=1 Tax=Vibrio sp. Of7-15 TaxID=2724879 RepID=UPI001EF3252C|nr:urease accessory protein UreF [Vibrio sp. Of7-15]MCG7497404.1 urease accessory protein UreF [Vibrio sp. Of7-15]
MEKSLSTSHEDQLATFRLFQLISPSLPIGGFTYSQGLEWAVESGWVEDKDSMLQWLTVMLNHSITTLELPVMQRYYQAIETNDVDSISYWSEYLYSCRETSELRAEEKQRGRALFTLLKQLDFDINPQWLQSSHPNQLLGFCLAAKEWHIPLFSLQQGYVWSWAENIIMAGVKLVPLGQTAGQSVLLELSALFPKAIEEANQIENEAIGSFTPSMAIASSRHETQYTRLFRS